MKTLLNGQWYKVTGDTEVAYLNGEIIPITGDGDNNWGIIHNGQFIPLHTFQVDGVLWYFTNDYQELAISRFATEQLPEMGIAYSDIAWFKTLPDPDEAWTFHVYFKRKGQNIYQSDSWQADNEEELIGLLTRPEYILLEDDSDEWLCLCGNNSFDYGFYTCDSKGEEMEPLIGSDWNGLYVCGKCGRIINGDSRKVVGRKTMDEH